MSNIELKLDPDFLSRTIFKEDPRYLHPKELDVGKVNIGDVVWSVVGGVICRCKVNRKHDTWKNEKYPILFAEIISFCSPRKVKQNCFLGNPLYATPQEAIVAELRRLEKEYDKKIENMELQLIEVEAEGDLLNFSGV